MYVNEVVSLFLMNTYSILPYWDFNIYKISYEIL